MDGPSSAWPFARLNSSTALLTARSSSKPHSLTRKDPTETATTKERWKAARGWAAIREMGTERKTGGEGGERKKGELRVDSISIGEGAKPHITQAIVGDE